jgi:tRNA modification GTPase
VPPLDPRDTIVAPATPPGPALRAILRLSGDDAWRIARSAFVPDPPEPPPRRRILHGRWVGNRLGRPIPAMLVLWAAPRSYTTQDVAEIHVPGAPAILRAILDDCLARGARLAEPGEFTLRAFLAGRLDLTRAEAVLAAIDADTPAQLNAALNQLAGGLADPVRALRDRLLDELAVLEATLDFTEEPDVAPLDRSRLAASLADAARDVAHLAARLRARDRAEARPLVVLHGPPNAGKSRLFNALLGRATALVADRPGTTRDYLQAPCDCAGLVVDLVDTAGIDDATTPVDRRAQHLRAELAARADLLLICHPADALPPSPWGEGRGEGATNRQPSPSPSTVPQSAIRNPQSAIPILTKSDLATTPPPPGWLATSAATGAGLDSLKAAIASAVHQPAESLPAPAATAARCHESLTHAAAALSRAAQALQPQLSDEFVALDLRAAVDALGHVVGAVVTDDVLDRVFSRFCIGK